LYRKIVLLYHTIKYLKFKQVAWRIMYFFPRSMKVINTNSPYLNKQEVIKFISKRQITKDFRDFIFLNEPYNLYDVGWDNKNISKLWRYNLHYFDCLLQENFSAYPKEATSLINKWIDENPFGKGIAWEPYPTSLRIINCIKFHFQEECLTDKVALSLWNQTRWLAARPEYHLLGNHLFVNAKALFFSSAFFKLDQNSEIYKKALEIFEKELDEQFLPDGAHFELSPMYHALAMEDLLDLFSIAKLLPLSFPKDKIEQKFIKGMQWLSYMIYENEDLSHFNDCANGIAPKYSELKSFANRIGLEFNIDSNSKLTYFKESGFVVFKDNNSHLIADLACVGPDYLPGHAHADTLSFELAIKGQRIIVNSGTSVYGLSQERLRQRGTAAHSTVQIDQENSSEVWSGFRVARRAKPFNINIHSNETSDETFCFEACHDGYKRLKNAPIHKRSWLVSRNEWMIVDEISGSNNLIISRFYLHPDIRIDHHSNQLLFSKNSLNLAKFESLGSSQIDIIDSTYHDEFGISRSNKCIQVKSVSPCDLKIRIELN
jgi:uncharacterized heparinase superfamily protein